MLFSGNALLFIYILLLFGAKFQLFCNLAAETNFKLLMQYSSKYIGNILHKSGKGLYECWMI